MNAICERLCGTLHCELLDRTLFLNRAHLRAVLAEYQDHYYTARPHKGLGQRLPDSGPAPPSPKRTTARAQIRRKPVLSRQRPVGHDLGRDRAGPQGPDEETSGGGQVSPRGPHDVDDLTMLINSGYRYVHRPATSTYASSANHRSPEE